MSTLSPTPRRALIKYSPLRFTRVRTLLLLGRMHPWLESILIVALSVTSFSSAYVFQRARWICMAVGILAIAAAVFSAGSFRGREYALLMSAAAPMVAAPLFRFPLSQNIRIGLLAVMTLSTGYAGWMEFFAAAVSRPELASLKTTFHDGVCIQSTGYTCGPAAAVTLLKRKGFSAEEGDLALLSKCSMHTGTDGPLLVDAIEKRFGHAGVKCTAVKFKDIDALKNAGEVMTIVNLDAWTDHWVVVLKITDTAVHTADPIYGLRIESREDFEKRWRWEGLTIDRR